MDRVRIGVGTGVLDEQLLQRVGLALVHRDDDLVRGHARRRVAAVVGLLPGRDARVRVRDRDLHPSGLGVARLGPVVVVDRAGLFGLGVGRRTVLGARAVVAASGGLDVVVVVTATADERDDADDHDDDERDGSVALQHSPGATVAGFAVARA